MLGLGKKEPRGQFVHVKNGQIVIKTKNAEGKTEIKDEHKFDFLGGYIRDIKVLDKDYQGKAYKEAHVTIDEPTAEEDVYYRYTLSTRMYNYFTDGLILSLANADLSKPLVIRPYLDNRPQKVAGRNRAIYCALNYEGVSEAISWVPNVPKVDMMDLPDGTKHPNRADKNLFINKCVEEINGKLKDLADDANIKIVPNPLINDPSKTEDLDDESNDDSLGEQLED